jgi:hypothetical protein
MGLELSELNMSSDSWDRYVNPDSQYHYDENDPHCNTHGSGFWHSEGGTLKQNYNNIRDSEVYSRNEEIFHNVVHFYFSRNGVIVLIISILLCLITSTFSPEGLFFWNVLLFIIVWGFYEITVRKEVRAEWDEIQDEINTF